MLVRTESGRVPLLFRGSVLADVLPTLLMFVAWSFVPTVATWLLEHPPIDLTPTPFTIVGLALSILLGFRNNACYDRWWEGRKTWGRLVNNSRSLSRQLQTLPVSDDETEALAAWKRENVLRVVAFVYALKRHLRGGHSIDELRSFLPDEEVDALASDANVPDAILHRLGDEVSKAAQAGWLHPMYMSTLQHSLVEMSSIQGICERIKKTPLPLPYSALAHRIVVLYCVTLPFGLVSSVGVWTPLVVSVMCFAFLGLDDVGTQLEDPFEVDPNDLPLRALANRIEIDLKQRLGDTDLPPVAQPEGNILI